MAGFNNSSKRFYHFNEVFKFLLILGKLGTFYVMAKRDMHGWFTFEYTCIGSHFDYYPNINYKHKKFQSQNQCLIGKINSTRSQYLDLFENDCYEKHIIICQKVYFAKPDCKKSRSFKNIHTFEIMLNKTISQQQQLAVAYIKAEITDMAIRLEKMSAYSSIFQTLWYSSLPCFDIRNLTAFSNGASALLQYCEWKGIPISCSAIFTTFPTDQGMCCSFNMNAADEIFVNSTYREMLQSMQTADKNAAFLSSSLPTYYIKNDEPKTTPGRNKGLVLMLDAHSDWLAHGSVDGNYGGFTAFVESSGSFPLMNQGGLPIKPGHNNIITLSSLVVRADDNIRSLKKTSRNCLFPDENEGLTLHQNYTYLNCKLECTLLYTQKVLYDKYNTTCQPWFFPTSSDSMSICDPWQSYDFFQIMSSKIPDNICQQCLPDCSITMYNPTVTVEPFVTCNANNIGTSQFCALNLKQIMPMQLRLASQIQNEFRNTSTGQLDKMPQYFVSLKSSNRKYGYQVFKKTHKTYDALDRDIAMVQIVFQKSTAILIGTQLYMTWIDYFSAVGGLLGLVLGMGFVTFIEIIWLCFRLILKA
jgi:hypothetical protein